MQVTIETVVERLGRLKGRWKEVADVSGVPYDTVTKVAQRRTKNPRYDTVRRLDETTRQLDLEAVRSLPERAADATIHPQEVVEIGRATGDKVGF